MEKLAILSGLARSCLGIEGLFSIVLSLKRHQHSIPMFENLKFEGSSA
jgi:hypothetical protein